PLLSKHMLTSEKLASLSGVLTACSTRKPSGTVKRRAFGLPPPCATAPDHGPAWPYAPMTWTAVQPVSAKSAFCQPAAPVFDAFHEPSLTTLPCFGFRP